MEGSSEVVPFIFDSLESGAQPFINPFTGLKVLPLEDCFPTIALSSHLINGYCLVRSVSLNSLGKSRYLKYSSVPDFINDLVVDNETFPYYFVVITNTREEIWKAKGPNKLVRILSRKRDK